MNDNETEDEAIVTAAKSSGTADEVLMGMLKDLRKKVAKKLNVPPFVVFQDPSLEDMALKYPISISELGNIHGVGEGKAKKLAAGNFRPLLKNMPTIHQPDRPRQGRIYKNKLLVLTTSWEINIM